MDAAALSEDTVREALRRVIDPEAGINIVDLGLIYAINPDDDRVVRIDMTMTSPTCPMGDLILDEVQRAVAAVLPAGWSQEVRIVWEPPWRPEWMSDEARAHFGWER